MEAFFMRRLTFTSEDKRAKRYNSQIGQVAQLVEQRIENPRVGGSIPPLATTSRRDISPISAER
jgi:hypothetical protein